jgi:putative inorganic carbon (HCO3(-)) transporter
VAPKWRLFAVAIPLVVAAFVFAKARSTGQGDPELLVASAMVAAIVFVAIWLAPPSWGISAALALSMFGSNWSSLGLPHSAAPDRWVLAITLVAIVVRAPGARRRPPIRSRPLYALMYVAAAYAVASAIAAGTLLEHDSIFELLDRMQILDWVVFIIAPAAFPTAADRRVLLGTLVGMGVYLGFTGIFEIIGPHALVFPRYILDPSVGTQFGRARGPFVEAVVEGLALYACALAAIVALREWTSRGARAIAKLAIAVCLVSLLLTFQRADWLGAVVAAAVTLLAVPELRRYAIAVALAVTLVVVVAFGAFPAVRAHAKSRLADVATVEGREAVDDAALAMIEARPLFGFGWNTFQSVFPNYFQTTNSYSAEIPGNIAKNPVHNVYLAIATDLGLVGITLWLLILLCGIGGAIFSRRAPPEMRAWQIALGSLLIMWLVVGVSAPLAASFESLVIYLWAAVIIGAQRTQGEAVT